MRFYSVSCFLEEINYPSKKHKKVEAQRGILIGKGKTLERKAGKSAL